MDSNFFEYLIIIFFIISAVRSIFGSKKKKERREPQSSAPKPEDRTTQKEESAKDILEELFGMKPPEEAESSTSSKPTKIPAKSDTPVLDPRDQNETTWNPEEEYHDSIGVKTVRYEDNKEVKPSYREEMDKMERMADKAKDSLAKLPDSIEVEDLSANSYKTDQLVSNIKSVVSNPKTLREYILVSEILNKPKALRR